MRNPVRLKNLSRRFLPFYLIGFAMVVLHRPTLASVWAAVPFLLIGTALRGWGAGHLVKNDALTMTGPYAYLRHPLYLGTVLIGTGFAVALGGPVGWLVVAAFWPWFVLRYFPRKEQAESERRMREQATARLGLMQQRVEHATEGEARPNAEAALPPLAGREQVGRPCRFG